MTRPLEPPEPAPRIARRHHGPVARQLRAFAPYLLLAVTGLLSAGIVRVVEISPPERAGERESVPGDAVASTREGLSLEAARHEREARLARELLQSGRLLAPSVAAVSGGELDGPMDWLAPALGVSVIGAPEADRQVLDTWSRASQSEPGGSGLEADPDPATARAPRPRSARPRR